MRTVFAGGRIFDGTGVSPAEGDLLVEDGRIVEVGAGAAGGGGAGGGGAGGAGRGVTMQISVTMISMTGGHNDPWLPSGAVSAWGVTYPGMPDGVGDGIDGVTAKGREGIRAGGAG